jgi:hypothetical protein
MKPAAPVTRTFKVDCVEIPDVRFSSGAAARGHAPGQQSPQNPQLRISAIVDADFSVIADGVSVRSWTITEARE